MHVIHVGLALCSDDVILQSPFQSKKLLLPTYYFIDLTASLNVELICAYF